MGHRVLLIDDDDKLRNLVKEYLEGYGFGVHTLRDGLNAIGKIQRESPDIVILDIMLPGKDGLEVLREIRADSAIPVIMLTAKGEDADRIVGLELGADDYLPKPFNPRELLARIKAVMRRLPGQGTEAGAKDDSLAGGMRRQLKAILSADVKNYSRLLAEDEISTIRLLNAYRSVIADFVRDHQGRVVDSPGDNILVEFGSVIHSVQCAVEIQKDLRARNARLPVSRRMEFRIGINLGDVILEKGKIYGDGVNIAARIEGLAEAGSICLSGSVYDEIENRLPLRCDYLGERYVKNISKPIRLYGVRIDQEVEAGEKP